MQLYILWPYFRPSRGKRSDRRCLFLVQRCWAFLFLDKSASELAWPWQVHQRVAESVKDIFNRHKVAKKQL